MSEKSEAMATNLEEAMTSFYTIIESATPDQLTQICPGDGWSIQRTAQHMAIAYRVNGSWIRRIAAGEAIPTTRDQIDAGNAQMAADPAMPDRDALLQMLRENGAKIIASVRNLNDEQLAIKVFFGPSNAELSASQIIRHVALAHINEHLADVRAALA